MRVTQKVKKILDWYEGDPPGVKANLARILGTGKLGGDVGNRLPARGGMFQHEKALADAQRRQGMTRSVGTVQHVRNHGSRKFLLRPLDQRAPESASGVECRPGGGEQSCWQAGRQSGADVREPMDDHRRMQHQCIHSLTFNLQDGFCSRWIRIRHRRFWDDSEVRFWRV
jgi:hypothetical protein